MTRVLVTGAAGFVGQAVVRTLLRAGHQVTALVRCTEPAFPPDVRVCRAELPDDDLRAAVSDVDGVCHLAGATRVRESFEDPVGHFRVNVGGTVALLSALERVNRPVRLVFASTAAVYGTSDGRPMREDQPVHPESPYADSKRAAELAVHWQAKAGRLGAVTLRAFNLAGAVAGHGDPDLTRLVPKLVAVAAGREPVMEINGDGTAVRDFLHVGDFAAAALAALRCCEPGTHRIYNVSGARASVAEVIGAVREVSGVDIPVRHRPPRPEPAVVVGDSGRIQQELGWRPERSEVTEIVRDAWEARGGDD
jgi:UDP-glucose 4-epimerase